MQWPITGSFITLHTYSLPELSVLYGSRYVSLFKERIILRCKQAKVLACQVNFHRHVTLVSFRIHISMEERQVLLQVRTRSMRARESPPSSPRSHSNNDSQPMMEEEETMSSPTACTLAENVDVLVCRATWLHYLGAYQVCHLVIC